MALAEPAPEPSELGNVTCESTDPLAAVMAAMAERPASGWKVSDLVRHMGDHVNVVDVMLTILEQHRSGGLERMAPATYRLSSKAPEVIRLANELRTWSTD